MRLAPCGLIKEGIAKAMSDYFDEDYRDYPELWDQESYEDAVYAEFEHEEEYPHESELVDAQ